MAPASEVSGVCLLAVDFDNAFPPQTDFTPDEISHRMMQWLQMLIDFLPSISTLQVRLYGGWYDASDLSRRGSEVAALLPALPTFPHVGPARRIIRGSIELAVAPMFGSSTPLMDTYRVRGSLPRIRVAQHPLPDACAHESSSGCPAIALKSFTRHRNRGCPADLCTLTASDVFVVHEQKMVDTMIATDLVAASLQGPPYEAVAVVSGDSDFVPPVLTAHRLGSAKVIQICPTVNERAEYATQLLRAAGIEVLEESYD